jgi:hypothetical protein
MRAIKCLAIFPRAFLVGRPHDNCNAGAVQVQIEFLGLRQGIRVFITLHVRQHCPATLNFALGIYTYEIILAAATPIAFGSRPRYLPECISGAVAK